MIRRSWLEIQVDTCVVAYRPSEDISALVQARFTDFSTENAEYPDLSNMKIKGVRGTSAAWCSSQSIIDTDALSGFHQKLPHPRDTKASLSMDVRNRTPKSVEKDPHDLFKMSKFRNVGSILCTQPSAARDFEL